MYLGKAGLLWQVSGGKIIELHRDWAMIDHPVNRSPRTFSPAKRSTRRKLRCLGIFGGEGN
jgi:hypothetical protein